MSTAAQTQPRSSRSDDPRTPLLLSFRYPGTKLYFAGLTVSMLGSWMQSIALSWLIVHTLNGKGHELGWQQMAQFLPVALLSAWAGSLADRIDKRKLMLITQVSMGVCALALGALDFSGRATLPVVLMISAVSGLASAFDTPVRRSLIGDLVPHEALPNAMALNTSVITSSRVLGMAIGGVVVKFAGTAWCFTLNGISYLAMIVAVTSLRERQHLTPPSSTGDGVWGAVQHVWQQRTLRWAMAATSVVALFTFNFGVTMPLMIERVFHRESDSLGLLMMAISVGSFSGAVLSARSPKPTLARLLVGAVIMGVATILLARTPGMLSCLLAAVPMGFGGGLLMSQLSGLLTSLSPATMRGRVLALQTVVFIGSTPFGGPIVGRIADRSGIRTAVAVGGWAALVGVVAVAPFALRDQRRQRLQA